MSQFWVPWNRILGDSESQSELEEESDPESEEEEEEEEVLLCLQLTKLTNTEERATRTTDNFIFNWHKGQLNENRNLSIHPDSIAKEYNELV